jgi:protein-tyrosine phosphatase
MNTERADIHFHLLPGVDDGPATIQDSLALARAAVRDGTSTVVATPHIRPDFLTDVREVRDGVRRLKEALARAAVPLAVSPGGELGHQMVGRLRQHELEAIAQGPPRRRWLLVETPFAGLDAGFGAATDELRDRGFAVVLAHPERSADLLGAGRAALDYERSSGSVLQVNASSLAGHHGTTARTVALQLVWRGLAGVVASDAHGAVRPPALTPAYQALIAEAVGPALTRELIDAAPRRLLARGLEPVASPA